MTSNQPPEPVNEPGVGAPVGGPPPQDQQPYLPPQQPYAPPSETAQPYLGQDPYPPQAPQPYPGQAYAPGGQLPAGTYPPAGAGYAPATGAYSQAPGPYPQAPGTYPQAPGAYPQAPGPYPQTPEAYPQAPGPYPQTPGAYPQAGPYPPAQGPYPQAANQPPYGPEPYAPAPGQAKPKGKGSLILGVTGGIVVLALAATLLMPRAPVGPPVLLPTAPATASPSASATVVVQTETAESAVQGYLEALSRGDAAAALAYADTPPADASMLTDEVLAAGLVLAPISDIQVSKGTGGASSDTIEATYTVGGVAVNASFPASKAGSQWRLQRVTANVNLASVHPDQIALRLNGAPVSGDSIAVFPGVYAISADDPRYALTATSFLVKSPDDNPDTYSMALALSAEGRSKVRAAAQKKLTSCLRQRSLKPSGCGFSTYLPGGNKPRNSTIRWKLTKGANAMKKLKPTVMASEPTVVRAPINVQLRVDLRSTNGRSWYGFSGIYAVTANLAGPGIKVTLG